jgi:hypothetical protein
MDRVSDLDLINVSTQNMLLGDVNGSEISIAMHRAVERIHFNLPLLFAT